MMKGIEGALEIGSKIQIVSGRYKGYKGTIEGIYRVSTGGMTSFDYDIRIDDYAVLRFQGKKIITRRSGYGIRLLPGDVNKSEAIRERVTQETRKEIESQIRREVWNGLYEQAQEEAKRDFDEQRMKEIMRLSQEAHKAKIEAKQNRKKIRKVAIIEDE